MRWWRALVTTPISSSDSADGRRVDRLFGVPQWDEVAACFACGVGNEERRVSGGGRAPEGGQLNFSVLCYPFPRPALCQRHLSHISRERRYGTMLIDGGSRHRTFFLLFKICKTYIKVIQTNFARAQQRILQQRLFVCRKPVKNIKFSTNQRTLQNNFEIRHICKIKII